MSSHRYFSRTVILGVSAFALLPLILFAELTSPKHPNVLFLIVDDMNDYGFYKTYPVVKTPYLDSFLKSALTFRKAYCASPVCQPSRTAVFSGLYPHTTGSYKNGARPWKNSSLLTKTESIPELFKRNGYITFGRGKLFGDNVPSERYETMWDNRPIKGGYGPFLEEKDQLTDKWFVFRAWKGPDTDFPDVKNSNAAIEFLEQDHNKPFFLALGLYRPHVPYTAPKRFFDLYEGVDFPMPPGYRDNDLEDVPPLGRELAAQWGERLKYVGKHNLPRWQKFIQAYFANTTFADWSIGRVIEALDRSKYADNTIVVFWSDHGYYCGEKDHWEKGTLWERSALSPLAMRVPGMVHAGETSHQQVSLVDLYPTLVDLCKLQEPNHRLEGESLRSFIENPERKQKRLILTSYGEEYASVRSERYRYIRYPDGTEELYDHGIDPHEFENLSGKPECVKIKESLAQGIPQKWTKSLGGHNY